MNSRNPDLATYAADLTIEPQVISENVPAKATTFVENIGEQNASNFSIALYADNILQSTQLISLTAGERKLVSLSWPQPRYGNKSIEVIVDVGNVIAEESEENNIVTAFVNVIDVSPASPELLVNPSEWTPLDSFSVSWSDLTDSAGIARYEYNIDYAQWTTNGLSTSLSVNSLGQGTHVVQVRGVDGAGNFGQTAVAQLKTDNTPPTTPVIREKNLRANEWNFNNNAVFKWSAVADEGSGVKKYVALIDELTEVDLSNSLEYSVNFSDGIHSFKLRAVDALNQSSNWSNQVIAKIDSNI